jgi:hypothetical protein
VPDGRQQITAVGSPVLHAHYYLAYLPPSNRRSLQVRPVRQTNGTRVHPTQQDGREQLGFLTGATCCIRCAALVGAGTSSR